MNERRALRNEDKNGAGFTLLPFLLPKPYIQCVAPGDWCSREFVGTRDLTKVYGHPKGDICRAEKEKAREQKGPKMEIVAAMFFFGVLWWIGCTLSDILKEIRITRR